MATDLLSLSMGERSKISALCSLEANKQQHFLFELRHLRSLSLFLVRLQDAVAAYPRQV